MKFHSSLIYISFLICICTASTWESSATAAQVQLNWVDNSNDEVGFNIERKIGTTGTYAQIASVGANVTSYVDSNVLNATTYCYRLNAFNAYGTSPYSSEACATTPVLIQNFTLAVTEAGTGTGAVSSSPAGINCGGTCSANYSGGTIVTLTPTPASGSTFAGWTGIGCTNGVVTMNSNTTVVMTANTNCTATFNAVPQQFMLSVTDVKTVTSNGAGNGTVTSSPAGINCGSSCSAAYSSGTPVTLTATPVSGSTFAGWSGTGCTNNGVVTVVTMDSNKSCAATFNPQTPQTYVLSIAETGTGKGTVTSNPAGISCGSTCSSYKSGSTVTLTATPASGSTFAGWTRIGCTNGVVTMNSNTTVVMTANTNCTATFQAKKTRIGIFRPSTGEWVLDATGNGLWDAAAHIGSFGNSGDFPVVGSWSGNGISNIGTFTPSTGTWQLDTNGDGVFLNCAVDTCIESFGQPGDFPVTRKITGLDGIIIGTYTPTSTVRINGRMRTRSGQWKFDTNKNTRFDGCAVDECDTFDGLGELPVVGDWAGTGNEEIGLFLPKYGTWYLDLNGNGIWDGCTTDKCISRFGTKGDLPVVGDWDGTGKVRIGIFRPSTGMWYLDTNGNGKLDACGIDLCLGPFGQSGDLPVVGNW